MVLPHLHFAFHDLFPMVSCGLGAAVCIPLVMYLQMVRSSLVLCPYAYIIYLAASDDVSLFIFSHPHKNKGEFGIIRYFERAKETIFA